MASTWSALKIELLETGQNSGTWGTSTNVNLGDAVLGEAITGQATVDFASDADVTITLTDSATTQAARNLRLNITESSSGVGSVRNLILGSGCQIEKFYLINNTGTGAKTVKNTSGTGISVPAGKATLVYNNGTNVVDAASYFTSLTLGSALPVASGGTGVTTSTGTTNVVLSNSPTLVTPVLGVATATSLQGIIGNVTPAAGTFTTVTGSNDASLNGLTVGRGAGALATNTAVGVSALAGSNSGTGENVALGYEALKVNTSGARNTAVGLYSAGANTTGSNNVAIGNGAFQTNISGGNNVAVGNSALEKNTASYNTASGYQAGFSNTTGQYNCYVGNQAGYTNTVNSANVAMGHTALYYNTGSNNVAIGHAALSTAASSNNVAVGYQAGYSITSGSNNTAIGHLAGTKITTGSYNVSVGRLSMDNSAGVTGDENTALGNGTMRSLTSGLNNSAVGSSALSLITTGSNNVAIGYAAAFNTTSDTQVIAIGPNALHQNTTGGGGSYNIAIGSSAHYYGNTDAYYNVAIGTAAMRGTSNSKSGKYNTAIGNPLTPLTTGSYCMGEITSGNYNVALGNSSLGFLTSGSSNIAIGANAQRNNSTGSNNTAVGHEAMYTNTAAPDNVAVGWQAGYYFNGSSGINTYVGLRAGFNSTGANSSDYGNTFIGYQAGYSLANAGGSQTGIYNTFIGTSSGYAMTTGRKNTILGRYDGNQGGLDIRTLDNYIVLSDGDGNPRVTVNNGGSVGFGVITSPSGGGGGTAFVPAGAYGVTRLVFSSTSTATVALLQWDNPNGNIGSISISGSSTSYNTSSDYRLKNTIAPMTGALAKVALLKPCTYKWNADGSDGEGFIAHELAEVCPQAVVGDKDAMDENGKIKPQGIDTSFLVATLTAAIQEQQAIIESLKARLDAANL